MLRLEKVNGKNVWDILKLKVADSLWDSIASCMDEAKSFYGNQITWIENDSSEGYLK